MSTELPFKYFLYLFICKLFYNHEFGEWSTVALDGLAEPGELAFSDDSIEYCGMFWTLGGKVGWKIPLRFEASLKGDRITYEFSVGTDVSYWTELTDKKKWERVYLLSRGELLDPWTWAGSAAGEIPIRDVVRS